MNGGKWPSRYQCAVCLTFDVDFEYAWSKDAQMFESTWHGRILMRLGLRHILGASLTTQSQGDFGRRVGLARILALLNKHDIKATFFVPAIHADTYPELIRGIAEQGHEVGHHGYWHESPLYFHGSRHKERALILKAADTLQRVVGTRPVGYRGPGFDLTAQTVRILREEGFLYDSSLMADEEPYTLDIGTAPRPFIEIPVDWSLDDFPHFAFLKPPLSLGGLANAAEVFETWLCEFKGFHQRQGCFTLTLHPSVIGRHSRLAILDRLIVEMKAHPGVWFARCRDVAAHVTRSTTPDASGARWTEA